MPKINLDKEIEDARKLVRTDSLSMSVGELATMYENEELVINPSFQRLFRWEDEQKSRLIESILLGIPIPSIFVFEQEDGTWELIDGLQRLSSIFQFMGILKEPGEPSLVTPAVLVGTRYLKALSNVVWKFNEDIIDPQVEEQVELEKPHQLAIRRSRLNVQILKRPSDPSTKYELFQRLNAGGTQANAQELRNSIVIMLDEEFSALMTRLAEDENFVALTGLSDDAIQRQRHMELVSRFIVYTFVEYDGVLDIEEFIDEGLMEVIRKWDYEKVSETFEKTFAIIRASAGDGALRRFNDGRFTGKFGYTGFELVAVGVARNINTIVSRRNAKRWLKGRIEKLWSDGHPDELVRGGMRGTTRISKTIPFGEDWFS